MPHPFRAPVSLVVLPRVTPVILLAMALGGAGMSGAVLTGVAPNPFAASSEPSPVPEGMELVESFTGDIDPTVTEGSLDLRTFTGPIHLVGWDEARYEINVYQRAAQGQSVGGDETVEATLESAADGFGLNLLVKRTGTMGPVATLGGGNDGPRIAVVASVPSQLMWTNIFLCSGATGGFGETFGVLEQLFGSPKEERDAGCVQDNHLLGDGGIHIDPGMGSKDEEKSAEIPFAVEGLHGGDLGMMSQYGSIAVRDATFAKADLLTQYGEIEGELDAMEIHALTQYGNVQLASVVDTLEVATQYGSIKALVLGGDSGSVNAMSQYGTVVIGVVQGEDRGYQAQGTTQYGDVVIMLHDAVDQEEEEDEGATKAASGLLPLLGGEKPAKPSRGDHGPKTLKAVSAEYDSRAVQMTLEAVTQYGDVLITDGELPTADPDQ